MNFSKGGRLYQYLKSCAGSLVTPEMIRAFKYTTDWGRQQKLKSPDKDDVRRRYDNIARIFKQ